MTFESLGQVSSDGEIIQMAFVVPDIREAVDAWVRELNIGPFFLIEHWTGIDPVYRGEPSQAKSSIAFGFAGQMQIELIQPEDDCGSVYKEAIAQKGYGFHHFGVATGDLDAAVKDYEARGYQVAFTADVAPDSRVAYLDGGSLKSGIIELIKVTKATEEMFSAMRKAGHEWDGLDPLRPIEAAL